MPGTASTNNSSARPLPPIRPSAGFRAKTGQTSTPPLAPVLLSLPKVDFDAPVQSAQPRSVAHSESRVQISTSHTGPAYPSPEVREPLIKSQESVHGPAVNRIAGQRATWWEHWSSGLVLLILMVALFVAAVIAFNDSSAPARLPLANENKETVPNPKPISSNPSLAKTQVSQHEAKKPAQPNSPQVGGSDLALPGFAQPETASNISTVSVRKESDVTKEPALKLDGNQPSTSDPSASKIQLMLPTPINAGAANKSTDLPGSNSHSLVIAVPSPGSMTLASNITSSSSSTSKNTPTDSYESMRKPNAMESQLSFSVSGTPAPQSTTSQMTLVSAVNGGLNDSSEPALPSQDSAQPVSPSASTNAGVNVAGSSESTIKPVAVTRTPEPDDQWIIEQWRKYDSLRNSKASNDANRYGATQPEQPVPSQPTAP